MADVTIYEVLSAVGLSIPTDDRRHYSVPCPVCDTKKKHEAHLDINLEKGVFRCAKCGTSGGMLDLYSFLTGGAVGTREGRSEAYSAIKGKSTKRVPYPKREFTPNCPIASVEKRDAVYRQFLDCLTLTDNHRKKLHERGLTDADIARLGYRSAPTKKERAALICEYLRMNGVSFKGIPGFWKENGKWITGYKSPGIFVPFKDAKGRIQGLQIRLDNAQKRKYRWLSGADRTDGTPAECAVHVVGTDRTVALITEGGLKADVIHAFTGKTVIAVPGVSSLGKLGGVLAAMQKEGLKFVYTAFDMDYISNKQVEKSYDDLISLLESRKLPYTKLKWDETQKGLDDWLLEQKVKGKGARE